MWAVLYSVWTVLADIYTDIYRVIATVSVAYRGIFRSEVNLRHERNIYVSYASYCRIIKAATLQRPKLLCTYVYSPLYYSTRLVLFSEGSLN